MKKMIKKFFNDFENITKYYNYLVNRTKDNEYVEITNEWLMNNYYLLVEHKKTISNQKKYLSRNYNLINDNYLFLRKKITQKNYNINYKYLVDQLKQYQKDTNKVFAYKELSIIPSVLVFIYIERLNEILKEQKQILINRDKVESVNNNEIVKLDNFISKDFDVLKNSNYIYEINKTNEYNTELFKELYKYLEDKNISLKELINDEYEKNIDTDILMSNIFSNLKEFFEYSVKDLFQKISLCEKLLSTSSIYKKMDEEEKDIYRDKIVFLAKKEHLDEYKYLEKNYMNGKKLDLKSFIEKNKELVVPVKEKIQINKNISIEEHKNYSSKKTSNIIINDIKDISEVSVLSNKKYSLIMDDKGNSFSRYNTTQLNRYRKTTENDYGIFLFIKDTSNNKVWSNTYSPMYIKPDTYEVVFSEDKIKYLRKDDKITTKTEIVVCGNHNTEIRKVTFENTSKQDKILELTSYTEPIVSDNKDDISHKVLNSMLIKTEYDKHTNSLIARRRSNNNYMVNRLIIDSPEDKYSYETERSNFIGRGNTINTANALNNKLSNCVGDNLDPVLSLRNKVLVKANSFTSVYLLVGYGRNKDQINEMIKYYDNTETLEKAFEISSLMNTSNENRKVYNDILNYLYNLPKLSATEERTDCLRRNALSQTGLWKFGISGGNPIITVEINDSSDIGFIKEVLKAFEYYKTKSIFIDIIIINDEKTGDKDSIKKQVNDELYRMYKLNSFYNTPGTVTVIDGANLTREDRNLLNIVPSIEFTIDNHISLKEAVNKLIIDNINDYPKYEKEKNIRVTHIDRLSFNNSYGGFKSNGSEYVIYNKLTPMPWSNVIANKTFGTIVTNNGCGYTYAYNSSEFKISSWSNETITNDLSEGFKFNNELFEPEKCTHGFGYSILESETKKLNHSITEFVATEDNVKIYLLKLTNKEKKDNNINIEYFIKPTLGDYEEKTTRYILSEFIDEENYLKLRNTYSINYSEINVFMTSSEKINYIDNNLIKNININLKLKPNEEKEIVFILGCSLSDEESKELLDKYTDINNCKKELKEVKDNWNKTLNTIEVKTPDNSFNYMMNGWYLYQTISSRIMAKGGFYKVDGSIGYRDRLEDSMNICLVKEEDAKRQILIHAAHQFVEGDVLHLWNEKNHSGLRSKHKDDHLWLVYATLHYLDITNDFDILSENIHYIQGEKLSDYEIEKNIVFNYSSKYSSLLDHCLKALELSMESLGSHNIPLIGEGDWNDSMNKIGVKGKGESVWLGFFLYGIIDKFIKMMKKYDKDFDLTKYLEFNDKLKESLNDTWDGKHYLRAFFDNKDTLGSDENTECKIELSSQCFGILSGVALKDKQEKIIKSIEEELVDNDNKIIKLLSPAFSESLNNPGYIMNYPKGVKDNGGQNTQAASWYIMTLIEKGYFDKAYDYFQMINPINRTLSPEDVDKYKVEPYVIADDINTQANGGWTWHTSSSSWFYRVGIEKILGINKHGDKLEIKPNIPQAWDNYKAVYHYKDTTYNIEVKRTNKDTLLVDDNEVISSSISLINDKKSHKIILNIHK